MTLVELLVAFAIVAVLSSLLVPALKTMTQRAQVLACSQNLERIGVHTQLYLNDHDDRYAHSDIAQQLSWDDHLSPYDGRGDLEGGETLLTTPYPSQHNRPEAFGQGYSCPLDVASLGSWSGAEGFRSSYIANEFSSKDPERSYHQHSYFQKGIYAVDRESIHQSDIPKPSKSINIFELHRDQSVLGRVRMTLNNYDNTPITTVDRFRYSSLHHPRFTKAGKAVYQSYSHDIGVQNALMVDGRVQEMFFADTTPSSHGLPASLEEAAAPDSYWNVCE